LDRVCPPFRQIVADFAHQREIKYVFYNYFHSINCDNILVAR
jgi:hypothetical protein